MSVKNEELLNIITKFTESEWNLINTPSRAWLKGEKNSKEMLSIIIKADNECGDCGCEYDPLYKRAIELLQSV